MNTMCIQQKMMKKANRVILIKWGPCQGPPKFRGSWPLLLFFFNILNAACDVGKEILNSRLFET